MGFHLVTDAKGRNDFLKVYSLREDGTLCDEKTFYPWSLKTIKSYSEEDLSQELIFQVLTRDYGPTFAILPNVGESPFQRTNKRDRLKGDNHPLMEDQARSWIQFDIDWGSYELRKGLHDTPLQTPLNELGRYVLKELGLPPDIGFVAQRSSSAKVKPNELRIRLYILLDKALTSDELHNTFSAYSEEHHPEGRGIDLSMVEPNRIHLVHDARILDDNIQIYETKGPDVYLQKGPRLKIDSLKSPMAINRRRKRESILEEGKNNDQKALTVVYKILEKQFKDLSLVPWKDQEALYKAIEKYTEDYPEDFKLGIRRNLIWWIIRYDLNKNGNADKALDFIMNNQVIANEDWRYPRVKDIEINQREYLLHIWGCGDIREAFKKEECKVVNSRDLGELSDEDIDELPTDDSILVLWSACGTGKTKLAKRLFKNFNPESSLSICYSKAAQLKNAQDFAQTYYLDAGMAEIEGLRDSDDEYTRQLANKALNDEFTRKHRFMSVEEHLASTAQSIRFGRDKYDWVFIDEIEHCLESLHFRPTQEGGTDLSSRLSENMVKLLEICSNAKFVMVADAKASDSERVGLSSKFKPGLKRKNSSSKMSLIGFKQWIFMSFEIRLIAYKEYVNW